MKASARTARTEHVDKNLIIQHIRTSLLSRCDGDTLANILLGFKNAR